MEKTSSNFELNFRNAAGATGSAVRRTVRGLKFSLSQRERAGVRESDRLLSCRLSGYAFKRIVEALPHPQSLSRGEREVIPFDAYRFVTANGLGIS